MTNILTDIADLVLGRRCIGCEGYPCLLCESCRKQMLGHAHIVREFTLPSVAADLRIPLAIAHTYAPPMSTVIFKFKDNHIPALAPFLAHLAAQALDRICDHAQCSPTEITVIPIPSRSMSIRVRGFDPMGLVARSLSTHGYHHSHALTDLRGSGRSKTMTVAQRIESTANAFTVRDEILIRRLAGRRVIVFDDVTTTGTTLKSAAEVLMQSGVEVIGCASIAGSRR